MKRIPTLAARLLLIKLLLFFGLLANAQNRIVRGKVTSADKGTTLANVTVLLKGGNTRTTTDANGNFSIQVQDNKAVLLFYLVDYATREVPVADNSTLEVALELKNENLGEVVVVGYGTVKKSDVTGAVVSLKSKDLTPGANINVEQTLMGRASGVQVYQKSGEPGSAMSVKIRGASSITAGNDPLYVIDGMPVNNLSPVTGSGAGFVATPNPRNPLNSLNPADIESVEILKDASATAIYGSRGSNGVVMITTKKGKSGRLSVNYSTYYGVQKASNSLEMLTGQQYKDVLNAIIDDGGGVASERVTNDPVNVDWQKELYRSANVQSHDLSLSGGKDNTRFYASLGYFNQEGVLQNSSVKRYTARLNLENSVAQKYAFGVSFNTSYIRDNFNSVGIGVNENASALYAAINYDPSYPIFNTDGSYNRSPFMTTIDHPLILANGQYANSDGFRTFGTVYGEYFFVPGFSLKIKGSGDVNITQRNTWLDPSTILGAPTGGIASINTGNVNYYMGEATLNYKKEFGQDHVINAVAGATSEHFGSNSFGGNGRGYALPDLTYNAIGTGNSTLNQIGSGRASTKIISFLGRVNYSYKDRYLLTASFRADGSSRFGVNNRFGYFPSVALGWKMHEESFLKGVSFIDELKFRVSYGVIGNQSIANYLYITTFSGGGDAVFGGNRYTSLAPSRVANPDLKWEAAKQADIGIDFALFDSRLTGSLEYYERRTSDLLLDLPQPLSTGFAVKTQNIGRMKNTGIDLHIAADVLRSKQGFNWNIGTVLSTVKNRVLSLGPLKQIITGGAGFITNASIIKPGESLGSYYGYEVLGVWQTHDDFSNAPTGVKPGDLKFRDLDNNKQINADDRVILGKSLPDFTYGITNTFGFRRVSLSVFLEGSKGGSVLNNAAIDSYFPISFRRNKLAKPYLNRWTPENPTNEYPSFVNPTSQGQQTVNSRTVEDASYLRLQSVRLSYDFNLHNKVIKGLQAYVTGQNLFTITKYSGIDPAVNSIGDDILKIDYSSYPMTRSFLFGLNVQF
ncbi:SusC/RagA family TonB-linked outer membrane protein [Chitinophaga pinensis]|uniref:TonB-dependent receptor n=1 Tax=Chitinophaga pinensis (strain ATCC 43595 / DSM 2588 / LMG 13176 / NBRC 15968 / NCIMB 11800 / UQM 2034) TaxID=485918 RepID=A0A979G3W3_CHIPD|nr:TonB-dependent receptor [Chitinophaga pinensis]ACU60324.1 TonB-dependent receptor [Chitinophaga pinensis DSM 2588]